jgi:tetratricopeptide (TPR) repeat protein
MVGQESSLKSPIGVGRRGQRWQAAAVCVVLAAMTFAVFGQTLRYEFINFDDNEYVYENPVVARGLTHQGVVWAFAHFHSANWHPLTWLSHMLDCQLYGLHPGGHHLTNVLLHSATVIALFLVLREMTGALWRSAFVAAVFAIHPLRVESVAWVAERKDVLSGLFFILALGAYVGYVRRPWSLGRYSLVLLVFALGLMCKPMLVTLPVALLLLDCWPLQRADSAGRLVLEKLPLLALSVIACVVTLMAQNEAIQSVGTISPPARFGNATVTCLVYLRQMIRPAGLAAYYPFPPNGLPAWEAGLAALLLAGFSIVVWAERKTQPWLLTGWLWYLVMLLPVAGLIQVGGQAHADRYTYLPQIGIYVAVTWLAAEWGAKQRAGRLVFGSLMTGVLVVLMVCAWKQTAYWKNSETLWTHTLACTTGNSVAHNNLGTVLHQEGRLDEAIIQCQDALQIKPDYAEARGNLGNALLKKGRVDEAITQYQMALQIKPGYAEVLFNLGNALVKKGKVDEAIVQYLMALQMKPDDAKTHNNLADALVQKGDVGAAIPEFQKALRFDPANPSIQNNLAWLLAVSPEASLRNGAKAVELARQADALTGGENPIILHTLAAACAEAGLFPEALETARHASRLADAQSNSLLAAHLQSEMELYEAGKSFHIPEETH